MDDIIKLFNRKEYNDWIRTMPVDYCPFCDWQNNQIILSEGKNWLWIANRSPYWNYHTMFITKKHYTEFDELEPELLQELQIMYRKSINKYIELSENGIIDIQRRYLIFWRFREISRDIETGINKPNHLHLHLVPDKEGLFEKIFDDNPEKVDVSILKIT